MYWKSGIKGWVLVCSFFVCLFFFCSGERVRGTNVKFDISKRMIERLN